MPRNSQGDYSLPAGSIVNTGDTVLPSQHNPPLQDIAQSLTNSLDRNGKGGMLADLPMNDKKITGLKPGTNSTDAATVGQLGTTASVPIGGVIDYWGATPPENYLFAAGQEVSRTTYAALFAVIGTAAGAGNGSTTFNLPDYRGRIGAGRENMSTPASSRLNEVLSSSTLGATGGNQQWTLTEAQMPLHTHGVTDPGHTHTYSAAGGSTFTSGFDETALQSASTQQTGSKTTGITIDNAGAGQPHPNVQPTIICNKIIRVS
jgi:microcystin-dependent protein